MKLEYKHEPNDPDVEHSVMHMGLYVASVYRSGMSSGGTIEEDDAAAEYLAKVFAASLDMLRDLEVATAALKRYAEQFAKQDDLHSEAEEEACRALAAQFEATIARTL